MKKLSINVVLLLFMGLQTFGQTQINKLEPEQYFDFWIGEWELTWETPSGINTGENIITKLLDNKVIQEEFWVINDPNMNDFKGRSWSVYNAYSSSWKQIWVDNQGSFFEFTAEFDGNNRIFKREIVKSDGSKILQRMVFYDIKENSFTWDWETSTNNGINWSLKWRIQYKRKEVSKK